MFVLRMKSLLALLTYGRRTQLGTGSPLRIAWGIVLLTKRLDVKKVHQDIQLINDSSVRYNYTEPRSNIAT